MNEAIQIEDSSPDITSVLNDDAIRAEGGSKLIKLNLKN